MSKRTPHRRHQHKNRARPPAGGRSPNYGTQSLVRKRVKKFMHKHQTWKGGKARKRKKSKPKESA